ncbi:MAG: hypothetical protein ACPG77_10700 [Nannocystaceae bacterium]
MSRHRFLDYNALSLAELERLSRDGFVDPEPGVDETVEFDDQFERRSNELNRKPYRGAQRVSIVEQRQGPWSGNNQLGNSVEFAPDTNNRQTVLRVDEWGMPQVWTLMLGISHEELTTNDGFGVVAKLSAGSGGAVQDLEIDWIEGTAITLPMNALDVVAEYSIQDELPTNLVLTATAVRGRLAGAKPTRTQRFSIPDNSTSDAVLIPPKATSLELAWIQGDPSGAGTTSLLISSTTSALSSSVSRYTQAQLTAISNAGGKIPLPAGAHYWAIARAGTGVTSIGAAIWNIAG